MYKVALVLSVAIWAVVIAIIFSTPTDVRRRVRMGRETKGKTTPAIRALCRLFELERASWSGALM